MTPTKFAGQNAELQKPDDMTDEQCCPLPIARVQTETGIACVSCWKGSYIDRIQFLFTGRVWLWVHSGMTQPPVYVGVEDPKIMLKTEGPIYGREPQDVLVTT